MKTVSIVAFAVIFCAGCASGPPDMAHPKRVELDNLRQCMSMGHSFTYCDSQRGTHAYRQQQERRTIPDVAESFRNR